MDKLDALRTLLLEREKVAVAFSGGVDSTFLLAMALEVLGKESVLAVSVHCAAVPRRERSFAREFLKETGARSVVLEEDVARIPGFDTNPADRCYHCKRYLFTRLIETSRQEGFGHVLDGTNADDLKDYRPGLKALRELGVESPLADLGFTKDEIRMASQTLRVPGWDRVSLACLATRFPVGQELTQEKLMRIDEAEECLRGLGFTQCRVRSHDALARIELLPGEMARLLEPGIGEQVVRTLMQLGFKQVTLDLAGYTMGSMNG